MDRILALVYSSEFNPSDYDGICKVRPDYMLPFGGRYRIIDFTLSNLTNYDISDVTLFAGKMMRSTLDHIGNGRSWELSRRRGGLTIFPPNYDIENPTEIETYYDSIKSIEDSNADYVFITNPMYISKVDINDAREQLISNDNDVLIFTQRTKDEDGFLLKSKIINSGDDNKPVSVGTNLGISEEFDIFAGSILMKREVLLRVLRYAIEMNTISNLLNAIFAFPSELDIDFYRTTSHLEIVRDTYSFFEANMKLLDRNLFDELFYKNGLVFTKSKDEPSTSYTKDSHVRNSLVANGAIIEGDVENSIIFRGVNVKKGAVIKNSIIFQDSEVGEDAILNFVITDKGTKVGNNMKLFGNRHHPYVSNKNEVIEEWSY